MSRSAPSSIEGTNPPTFVSALEAARFLGLSRSAVYVLMDSGVIDSRRVGRRRLVVLSSLNDYAATLLAS